MEDVCLVHQALSCLNWQDIDTGCRFMGKQLEMPLIINAITGGPGELTVINRDLARAARETGIAMAVGSQSIALQDTSARESFEVVRRENPDGVVLANVSALTPVADVVQAVSMLEADAVQLHLNIPQELAMAEGDRDFSVLLERIAAAVDKLDVPVIVKEVGFGLSRETACRLQQTGVTWLDVGGKGGTNFAAIEARRFPEGIGNVFKEWGISTVCSILEVKSTGLPYHVIASGGIRSGLDMAKAIALGADLTGVAGPLLRVLLTDSYAALLAQLQRYQQELKAAMMLTGAGDLKQLQQRPWVVTGATREWCFARGLLTAAD